MECHNMSCSSAEIAVLPSNRSCWDTDGLKDDNRDYSFTIITLIINIVVCIFGLIGNFIVMLVTLLHKNLRTASSIFIFNLALSDFIFLCSLPLTVTTIWLKKWIFGDVLCKILMGCFGINLFVGVLTLVSMSIDRYIAVCRHDWNRYRTVSNSVIFSCLTWIVSICLILPLLLYSQEAHCRCDLDWPQGSDGSSSPRSYILYTLVLGFIVPVSLICTCYLLIIVRLRQPAPTESSKEAKKKRTRRVTILVLGILLAYIVCWLPYWAVQIKLVMQGDDEMPSPILLNVFVVATWLYHCNSALNPLLYGFFSERFRSSVLNTICCKKSSNRKRNGLFSFRFTIRAAHQHETSGECKNRKCTPYRSNTLTCDLEPDSQVALMRQKGESGQNDSL